jgi:hypothetical protein
MSVVVYPRLGALLRGQGLTVADLRRQIESRIGLAVDPKTLYRLARNAAVRRADLEVAGAAAAVLGVGLGDLFEVHASPAGGGPSGGEDRDARTSRRLAELFSREAARRLSCAERAELERLLAAYGRRSPRDQPEGPPLAETGGR